MIQTSEDVFDKLQFRFDLEDGDRVSTRVEDWTGVTVGNIDERLRELGRSLGKKDLAGMPFGLRWRVGREDRERSSDSGGTIGCWRDGLLGKSTRELMKGVDNIF